MVKVIIGVRVEKMRLGTSVFIMRKGGKEGRSSADRGGGGTDKARYEPGNF